ncbi:putative porin [Oxalobacteraceae bacterium OTU3CINTB1]|nr:putative porin [Oxalobacteraceae bacterium OTU3CINTB1]
MKNATIALTIALLSSSAVYAQEAPQLTRAQVVAEYKAAVAAGLAPNSGELYAGSSPEAVSTKTRDEVRAELRLAQQRGEVVSGEQYPQFETEAAVSMITRAQVRAELAAYLKANPHPVGEVSLYL